MPEESRNDEINRLQETVLYVAADGERKNAVTNIFLFGWIISGLVIIFLELNHGRDAALMALQVVGIAGSLLWLINNWWKHRLSMKYSPDNKV